MDVTIVGCAGSFPGPDSPASSYLLQAQGHNLVLDMGNGSLGALQKHCDVYDIDAVLLSHLHVDHCIDLCSYYVARKYHPRRRTSRIPVFGPTGTADRMADAYGLARSPGMAAEFNFMTHSAPVTEVGPFRITTIGVNHPVEAYAIRVEADGRSVVYSGDTGPTPNLVDLAASADVALFEASFLSSVDNPPNLHLTGPQAAEHARRADVGSLVLTHLVPWYDREQIYAETREVYDGDLCLAKPGMTFTV